MAVDVALEGLAETDKALGKHLTKSARTLLDAHKMKQRALSIVLTDDVHIRALNAQWRDEDKPTDVLSFPVEALEGMPIFARAPLGDIVISVEYTRREAELVGHTLEAHATFLLVHGFCHLLGHDHLDSDEAAAMRAEEDRLLAIVAPGQARPPTPY